MKAIVLDVTIPFPRSPDSLFNLIIVLGFSRET